MSILQALQGDEDSSIQEIADFAIAAGKVLW